jgi:hypothetical protein
MFDHTMAIPVLKYVTATLPGVLFLAATGGLEWLDGLTPMQGLGSGAVVVVLAVTLYRIILKAFDRADQIHREIITDLRKELERLNCELVLERELRTSLERAGIKNRRRNGLEEER